MSRIKVLIVDDSALMRQLMTKILSSDPAIEVIGSAPDPYVAWEMIHRQPPDVLTLDVEMPRMDGLTFLRKLRIARPIPVVIVSSLTEAGCDTTLRALELGAVDYVTKPTIDVAAGTVLLADEILTKVKVAATARVQTRRPTSGTSTAKEAARPIIKATTGLRTTQKVIALGASTGGTEALFEVLSTFPPDAPGAVVVLHMPEKFTASYAKRLDASCRVRVREACDGDRIIPGHVLLAPGGFHMAIDRAGAVYSIKVFSADPVNQHRPSVDVLFDSCARHAGQNCVAALLTGMGTDGAKGLLNLKQSGAFTIAQNEATCVVYGMPREAVARGAAHEVLPLGKIAQRLLDRSASGVLTQS